MGDDTKKQYTLLRVHQYDPNTKSEEQKRLIQLGDYAAIKEKKLDIIRSLLVKEGVFDSPE